MKTIAGLIGVVALAVLAVLAWNWWNNGNSSPVKVVYPTEGAVLSGNSVPVRLSADQNLVNKLNTAGSETQIITYLNGKEVNRSRQLDYNLTAIQPGQHRLEIGVSDQANAQGVSLSVMPKPVNFVLGGGSGANQNTVPGAEGNIYSQGPGEAAVVNVPVPTPTATPPVVVNIPAPAPEPTALPQNVPAALPASGAGGTSALPRALSNTDVSAAQVAIPNGSQSQLPVSATKVSPKAVASAELAQQNQNENPLSGAFRGMLVFYLLALIVAIGAIFVVARQRR